jgi:hypothetical protein
MIKKADMFEWNINDEVIINTFLNLRSRGFLKVNDSGKFEILYQQFDDASNYLFFNVENSGLDDCILWHDIMWNNFKEIAPRCLNCWKVVINFPCVADLYKFYKLIQSETNFYGKCGFDRRKYTKGYYKAFIYNDSYEEAMEKYKILCKLVPESKWVIVKRGCTEFEDKIPSTQWVLTKNAKYIADKIAELIEPVPKAVSKPWMDKKIYDWFRLAAAAGDTSYEKVIAQKFEPWVHCITYHDKPVIIQPNKEEQNGEESQGNPEKRKD